jgi:hypothetical protein
MRIGALAFALLLIACGGPGAPQEADPAMSAETDPTGRVLSCDAFASLTPAVLAQRFGAENITTQTVPGAEGESYEATVVFANDPTQRLEIVWNDARTAPASVSVESVGTAWHGAEGYTIGSSIADIERINVMPFQLWGFGWDYGGWVSDWRAGTLAQTPCRLSMRFNPRNENATGAMGDSAFMSNDQAVRDADPVVSEIGLMFVAQ